MAQNLVTRAGDWVDDRTGYRQVMASLLDEPIPGGSSWAYIFGSALTIALLLQFVTGVLLAFYYVPTIDHAHTSVAYIQKEVMLGWLVRGVHFYGASAVIIVMLLHLSQVFVWGAYKERREVLWIVGVLLLNVLLGFGFTGYLLPWDQKAYFGTQVAGGIAGSIPVVGADVSRILLGGAGLNQLTLSRFFALHVFVLPASIVLLVAVHLYLFRRHGPAGPTSVERRDDRTTERFYPKQFFKDTAASVLLAVVLALLAGWRQAPLGPEADPSASFVPRPEWYFLWTFQLLKLMPAFVGGVVIPGVLMTALALVPFLDRGPDRRLRRRLLPIGVFLVVMGAIAGLTGVALYEDASNPQIARQEEQVEAFMQAPFEPDRIGEVAEDAHATKPPPQAFSEKCAVCHGPEARGGVGPSLVGVTAKPKRSVDDIVALIADPSAFGLDGMTSFPSMPESERRAIAEWIASLE